LGKMGPTSYQTTAQAPGGQVRDVSHDPRYADVAQKVSQGINAAQASRMQGGGPRKTVGSASGGSSDADIAGPAAHAPAAQAPVAHAAPAPAPMPRMPQPQLAQPAPVQANPTLYQGQASGGSSNLDF
jgi:hypothetical protein